MDFLLKMNISLYYNLIILSMFNKISKILIFNVIRHKMPNLTKLRIESSAEYISTKKAFKALNLFYLAK